METSTHTSYSRSPDNGLVRGVSYIYRPDGSISWKEMITTEGLAIKREYEMDLVKKYNKPLRDIDKTQLEDNQLLILLGGIKRLLALRGYNSVRQHVDHVGDGKCVCTCTIEFIGNYETEMRAVTYSDVASATLQNTSGDISQMFLEATAANRALVRAVRGFLNIGIVGADEMGPPLGNGSRSGIPSKPNVETGPTPTSTGFDASTILAKRCAEIGMTFEVFQKGALKYAAELKVSPPPETWKGFTDVGPADAWMLWGKIEENRGTATKAKK